MRSSERWAVGAVAAMTAPAFIAFPALGLWYVAKVWPAMGWFDRGLFCLSVSVFCAGLPYGFRRGLRRVEQGCDADLSPVEVALLVLPMLAGGWALLHRADILMFMLLWFCFDLYRAHKRHRGLPPPTSA